MDLEETNIDTRRSTHGDDPTESGNHRNEDNNDQRVSEVIPRNTAEVDQVHIPIDDEPPPPYDEVYSYDNHGNRVVIECGEANHPLRGHHGDRRHGGAFNCSGCHLPKTAQEWVLTLEKYILRKGGGYSFIAMMVLLAVPQLWFGCLTDSECPSAPMVPIHLIISGCIGMVTMGVLLVELYFLKKVPDCSRYKSYCVNFIFFFLLLGWYIYGNILAAEFYRVFRQQEETESVGSHYHYLFAPPEYLCKPSTFALFFWSQVTVNVLWFLWIILALSKYVCKCRSNVREVHSVTYSCGH